MKELVIALEAWISTKPPEQETTYTSDATLLALLATALQNDNQMTSGLMSIAGITYDGSRIDVNLNTYRAVKEIRDTWVGFKDPHTSLTYWINTEE